MRAKLAGDLEWMNRHLAATMLYHQYMKSDLEMLNATIRLVVEDLKAHGIRPTSQDVARIKQQLKQGGLPQELVGWLIRMGFTPEQIALYNQTLQALNESLVINYDIFLPLTIQNSLEFHSWIGSWIQEQQAALFIPAMINIDPDTLNIKSRGRWITAYIEIPGYDPAKIKIDTVMLDGLIWAVNDTKYGFVKSPEIKDRDGDEYPELMVKFPMEELVKISIPGEWDVHVIGELDGAWFIGSDRVRVLG